MATDASPISHASPEQSPRARSYRWLAILLLVAGGAALAGLQYADSSELTSPANIFLGKVIAVGVTTILLFVWFLFLSGASRAIRIRTGLIAVVLTAVGVGTVRVEGVSGDVAPRFKFRWAPRADETLPSLSDEATPTAMVDLNDTTATDYSQFMGPDRRATLDGVHLASDWSTQPPKQLWRQPIGAAWSSFAVVNHYAVTQEQRGELELTTCYDIDSGKPCWSHETPVRFFETLAGVGPRATPTIHQGKVYALGAMGHLNCLDGATGKPLWQHDIVQENHAKRPMWGKSGSPLVHENLVIVSAGGADGKSLVAYDTETGKPVWAAGDDPSSYSSPTLLTLHGIPQIVIVNERSVAAHDPADGRVLWTHPWPDDDTGSPNVSQPIAAGEDRVLLSKGYGVGSALWQIEHAGDAWSVKPIWKNHNMKTKFTSPVLHDGYAYGLDEGILSCIDVSTGAKKWKQGKYGHGQILLVDDKILVQSESGDVALVEAKPERFRELTRFSAVRGTGWNPPALSGRKLLVRSDEEAACYELPVALP